MKVALYVRVSTGKQAEKNLSIPDQLKQLEDYCKLRGDEIYKEYIEEGASATDDKRAVFLEMIDDAMQKEPPFSLILVLTTSRFFRDAYLAKFYKKKLQKRAIKVKAIHQEVPEDHTGKLIEGFFELIDEHESQMIGYHTLRGMRENARRGFFNGSTPKFGLKLDPTEDDRGNPKKRFVLNPPEVPIIRKIFNFYASLHGAKQIAEILNKSGESHRGKPWTKNFILNMLSDPAYCGNYYYNKFDHKSGRPKPKEEWIKIGISPIISRQLWERVQRVRGERDPQTTNPAITGSKTLLTGIARCGLCGSGMQLETGKGGKYSYYNCRNYVRSGKSTCRGQRIPVQELESTILTHMANRLFTKERIKKIISGVFARVKSTVRINGGKRAQLLQERRDIEKRLTMQYEAIEKGIIGNNDVAERLRELKAKRAEIDDLLLKTQNPVVPLNVFTERSMGDFQKMTRDLFLSSNRDFTKRYLKLFIDRIIITERQVRIEGKPTAILAAIQNKTAVRSEVPTAVNCWLPFVDSFRTFIVAPPKDILEVFERVSSM